jgi:hypothetical protein
MISVILIMSVYVFTISASPSDIASTNGKSIDNEHIAKNTSKRRICSIKRRFRVFFVTF